MTIHGVERELVWMRKSVKSLPKYLREQIVEFFSDRKAGHHYVIELRSAESAGALAHLLLPLRCSVLLVRGRKIVGEVRV